MSRFNPLTLGYDWETWILGENGLTADREDSRPIAMRINRDLKPMEGHLDGPMIECGSGIIHEWPEMLARTERYAAWLREQCAAANLSVHPSGTVCQDRDAAGMHIHVGSLAESAAETAIANALIRYVPALLALAANSPYGFWRQGEAKSYRGAGICWGSGGAYQIIDAHLMTLTWESDIAVHRSNKPTVELRLADSAIHPRLGCEIALLAAGLIHAVGENLEREEAPRTPDAYEEALANRLAAVRHGLQATFTENGRELPATEAVWRIIDRARPGMRLLGASEEDLALIPRMLAKRVTGADFQRAVLHGHTDLLTFQRSFSNIMQADAEAFTEWLAQTETLDALPPVDMDEEILRLTMRETDIQRLVWALYLSPALLETRLKRLDAQGRLHARFSPEDGIAIGPARRVPAGVEM